MGVSKGAMLPCLCLSCCHQHAAETFPRQHAADCLSAPCCHHPSPPPPTPLLPSLSTTLVVRVADPSRAHTSPSRQYRLPCHYSSPALRSRGTEHLTHTVIHLRLYTPTG